MIDYSQSDGFSHRQMIRGWYDSGGRVIEIQAFYCKNGPEIDGRWNVIVDGKEAPGPENTSPYYYAPEVGMSMGLSSLHEDREEAVLKTRHKLENERLQIDKLLRELV